MARQRTKLDTISHAADMIYAHIKRRYKNKRPFSVDDIAKDFKDVFNNKYPVAKAVNWMKKNPKRYQIFRVAKAHYICIPNASELKKKQITISKIEKHNKKTPTINNPTEPVSTQPTNTTYPVVQDINTMIRAKTAMSVVDLLAMEYPVGVAFNILDAHKLITEKYNVKFTQQLLYRTLRFFAQPRFNIFQSISNNTYKFVTHDFKNIINPAIQYGITTRSSLFDQKIVQLYEHFGRENPFTVLDIVRLFDVSRTTAYKYIYYLETYFNGTFIMYVQNRWRYYKFKENIVISFD